jgi:hypothetical protein
MAGHDGMTIGINDNTNVHAIPTSFRNNPPIRPYDTPSDRVIRDAFNLPDDLCIRPTVWEFGLARDPCSRAMATVDAIAIRVCEFGHAHLP